MPIPGLPHLQFLILASLSKSELPGAELREILGNEGVNNSRPAFYQLIGRLELSKYVSKRYEGKGVRKRVYTITDEGIVALESTRDFYQRHRRTNEKES